jgi:hypothetical protein
MKYSNCLPPKAFWVNNGPVLKNVGELPTALRRMSDKTFHHHVNKDKNDFAKWIQDVFGDARLADALRKSRGKDELIRAIERALT